MNTLEIVNNLNKIKEEIMNTTSTLSEEDFIAKPSPTSWSVAEQVFHLMISTNESIKPYVLPGFVLKVLFGKKLSAELSYSELEANYDEKIEHGAKASGKFAQIEKVRLFDRNATLNMFMVVYDRYIRAFEKCSEDKLDQCQIPHPILGKISLRELGYFTIFHTKHHLQSIQKLCNK